LLFAGSGGVSVGVTNGSVVISGATSGAGGIDVTVGGNTSGTLALISTGTLFLAGGNNVTLSQNGNSLTVSAASQTVQTQASGNIGATGFATTSTNGSVIAGTNNTTGFTLGVPPYITTQTNQTLGLYATGNTTQSSSGTVNATALTFNGLGAQTVGISNGMVQLSVPATSSLSGTGAVSISTNGSTISIGVANAGTISYYDNGILNGSANVTQLGQGSVIVQPFPAVAPISISALRQFIQGSFSTSSNSSYAGTLSVQAGIYTLTGSTLSLASSGSQSFGYTQTSNNSSAILTGIKGLTIPLSANMSQANYWMAMWSSTSSQNANWATFSNLCASEGPLTYQGILGSSSSASNQGVLGGGYFSVTSAGLPASIGLSQITGAANIAPFFNIYNVTA